MIALIPFPSRFTSVCQFLIDFAGYALVRLVVALIQTLPLDMGDRICRSLAWLIAGPLAVRRKITDANLRLIFPDSSETDRRRLNLSMWHHLMLMVCEIAWAQRRLHLVNWRQHVRFRNNRTMLHYMLSDRPLVMVTGHYGNFEVGGYMTGVMGFSTLAIARRLDNRFLHDWVERFRGAKGQHMVDKDGCATAVDRHLQEGGILSLLADQHAAKGCWVNFMGAPAACHKALALFTLTANAPMMVGSTRRIGGEPMQFEISCSAVADPRHDDVCGSVNSLTKWYNEQLAVAVGQSIDQYWWLHRRWRTPPEKIAKRMMNQAA